jgi:hypothetical protein
MALLVFPSRTSGQDTTLRQGGTAFGCFSRMKPSRDRDIVLQKHGLLRFGVVKPRDRMCLPREPDPQAPVGSSGGTRLFGCSALYLAENKSGAGSSEGAGGCRFRI